VEYLVTMTTHVPSGTPDAEVADVRAREGAHTRDLAAEGHVLRLWRPPLAPGEWRTIGLFAADGPAELERVLASMPLRVWRTDEVTALSPHPNDPHFLPDSPRLSPGHDGATEFLVTFTPAVPPGTPEKDVADADAREAVRAGELAEQGHLVRLWKLPAPPALGLWRADGDAEMRAILESLPLYPYVRTETTRLTPHPSDPAAPGSRSLREPLGGPRG